MTFPDGKLSNNEEKNTGNVTCRQHISVTGVVPPVGSHVEGSKGSDSISVSALVAKSKKAASSLWTLLHAKNCSLAVSRCSYLGCPEAKLVHLHLKTCGVADGESCPTKRKGCEDARKLLSHYRRCRDIRARQAANRVRNQQHLCLVCSLVARHAKSALDCRSTSPKGSTSTHMIPSIKLSCDSYPASHDNPRKQPGSRTRSNSPPQEDRLSRTPKKMPPPPPRFPSSAAFQQRTAGKKSSLTAMNALATVCQLEASSSNLETAEESLLCTSNIGGYLRPRAESLDSRRTHPKLAASGNWTTTPELSDDLISSGQQIVDMKGSEICEKMSAPRIQGRRRSASCSIPSSRPSKFDPDPILEEEPVGEDYQYILEGDA